MKSKLLKFSPLLLLIFGFLISFQNCTKFNVSSTLGETDEFNLRKNFLSSLDGLPPNNGSPEFGNGSISAMVNNSELKISTTARLAGAIGSLTFRGHEYINQDDHGRELQSASSYDGFGECLNPTEAGSSPDDTGPTSTSYLLGYSATGNQLKTSTQMAFWLSGNQPYNVPGGCGGNENIKKAQNKTDRSNDILYKQVTIGFSGLQNVIEYLVTFHVAEAHQSAVFEALTGYLGKDFSLFYSLNPTSNSLTELSHEAGEQKFPIILANVSKNHAMGIYSPDLPMAPFLDVGYGRFDFAPQNTMKWNAVYRTGNTPVGDYSYRQFVIVGTLAEVQSSMIALHRKFHPIVNPGNVEPRVLKIKQPIENEVIPIGTSDLKMTIISDKFGDVPLRILSGGSVLQSESLHLGGTESNVTIFLNDAVKNHRGDFLTLKIGEFERKIGIGFSFVVAGQSNSVDAECSECLVQNIRFSTNPRVVSLRDKSEIINIDDSGMFGALPEVNDDNFKFEPLKDSSTFIHGAGLNVWNRVGKKISDQYNVPVSFVIIGKGGTSSTEWKQSLVNRFGLAQGFKFTGVLWHQGESDAIPGFAQSKDEYIHNLEAVVKTVKNNFGLNSPWMIAQTSICRPAGTTPEREDMILTAQAEFTQKATSLGVSQSIYLGPNTNLISHTCHFDSPSSFNEYADIWASRLQSSGLLTQKPPVIQPSGEVIGTLDSVTLSGRQTTISGWACGKGIDQGIEVHVYYNGAAGAGSIVTSGVANQARENAVKTSCESSTSAHGFNIQLSEAQSELISGKKIYVHGIATTSAHTNKLLSNSGLVAPVVNRVTPVNGGWSAWANQGSCSKTCGGGEITQIRSCTSPAPSNGGANCSGAQSQVISCNTQACTVTPPSGEVMGILDSVTLSGRQTTISGWACGKGINQGIEVHVYYNGAAGAGSIVTSGVANQARENAVKTSCESSTSAHGFNIQLSEAQSELISGKKIYVHGIATTSAHTNKLLSNSGLVAPVVNRVTPVNGGWSAWANQGSCSKTCGGGEITQIRSCTSPAPSNGGANCSGAQSQIISCNTQACQPEGHPTASYPKMNVYRFFQPAGGHFLTSNSAEGPAAGYSSEGIAFKSFAASVNDPKAIFIYRCYIKANGHHFVSIDSGCEGSVPEGNLGKVYSQKEANLIPVYRLYNSAASDHLITTNPLELSVPGYSLEGILGYVTPQ